DRKAPEVFWYKGIRLRSLPVTTILLLTIIFTTSLGSDVDVHGVRGLGTGPGTPAPSASRPTWAQAGDECFTRTQGCDRTATPDALGAATSGLFVRDTSYAATGVPFFGAPGYATGQVSGPVWLDRAGLMESAWERSSDLRVPFLPADGAVSTAVTGSLILNSTRVADGCRMWVSQVLLAAGDQQSCDFSPTPAGHTVDLFGVLGAG